MLHGFNDRDIATRLKEMALALPGHVVNEGIKPTDFYLFQTPPSGIPAISGDELGMAECDAWYLKKDASTGVVTREALKDPDDNQLVDNVYNMGEEDVEGDSIIQAARINGIYVANWEDCS